MSEEGKVSENHIWIFKTVKGLIPEEGVSNSVPSERRYFLFYQDFVYVWVNEQRQVEGEGKEEEIEETWLKDSTK